MPKFAANLTMLFNEHAFLERFEQAAQRGFKYVEYLFPYEWAPEVLREALQKSGLKQVLFNLPPGDWGAGERGIACHPDRVVEFEAGVDKAIRYAQVLGVKQINCLAGLKPESVSDETAWKTMIKNVEFAAKKLAQTGMTLLVEPINSRVDMPGFFIDTLDKALLLLDQVSAENVKIQYDFYHMQIMHGDVLRNFEQHLHKIAHVQFADNPGRHEPGTGELNFEQIFKRLDDLGYTGWASAEYKPLGDTISSLNWLQTFN